MLNRRLVPLLVCLCLAPGLAAAQGLLVPTETQLPALPTKLQVVNVSVVDGTAVTSVDQRFGNPTGRPLEATYIFPVPKGAAVEEFSLWMNGKKTKGEVLEKNQAAAIYTDIVRRMKDPGLLEYLGNDLFRARVFPVPPSGEMRIEIKYSQVLAFDSGVYHYKYPLGASKHDARPLTKERFVFTAKIQSQIPLKSVYSPTHTIGVSRRNDGEALAGFEPGSAGEPARDLDLYYTVSKKDVGLSLLTFRQRTDEPGYFLALVSPKQEWQAQETANKRVTFVIDTSGSMTGDRMPRAKAALKYCLSRLPATDRFNVVRFSTDVEPLFPATVEASASNVEKAQSFVAQMEPLGGTNLDEALRRALSDGAGAWVGPHIVVFITDGEPTVGETEESKIVASARAANAGGSQIFTFGVGNDINARLLDSLAAEGRGVPEYAANGADFERKISSFYDKLAHPVLSDLALSIPGVDAYDIYPRQLPDLFRGGQLVVLGRYRTPKATAVSLAGSIAGTTRSFAEDARFPEQSDQSAFIPRLWAVRKVGFLLEEIRRNGERSELKDEVIALGKKFGIVTPYTSYLVLEDTPVGNIATRQPMPDDDRRREDGPGRFMGGSGSAAPAPPASAPARDWTASPAEPSAEAMDGLATGGVGRAGGKDEYKPRASSPKKAAAPSIGTSSGEGGVAVSKKLKEMKEEEKASDAATQFASGRTFVFAGQQWRDTAVTASAKTLTVKYLSDAYFALVSAKPELRAAIALGSRVVVGIPGGQAIAIDPDRGVESKAELEAFLR